MNAAAISNLTPISNSRIIKGDDNGVVYYIPAGASGSAASLLNLATPTGAVMAFAMENPPAGWLWANGAEYSKTGPYASLYAVIGHLYGETNGAGAAGNTHFRVPDLRGYFVRGYGTNLDNTTSGASGTFGTKQVDMVGPHVHPNSVVQGELPLSQTGWRYDGFQEGSDVKLYEVLPTPTNDGTETRPKNIAMLYCIKT